MSSLMILLSVVAGSALLDFFIFSSVAISFPLIGFSLCLRSWFFGGTIADLSLGSSLSILKAKVHAFSVCDDPDYFHNFTQGLLDGLKAGVSSRDIVHIQNAKGLGYAMNTSEELNFVKEVATATGVVLDPVYRGKAAYAMVKDMSENPKKWEGRKILFIHTGGLLGLYDKVDQLASFVGNWQRMDVNESVPKHDGIGKMF
ncbi:Bifunctional D-cysteine desulfhydrase/1-aminocyclopropane-1-carboxylate deaminase, mitochondrial [Glycine soja]